MQAANSTIKYVKSASQPADDAAYTGTYSDSTTITVESADVIWLLVTAEDTTTKLYYKITVTVSAPLSSDATLKASSTVKGETIVSLGTPNATLGSEVAGSVTITGAKAANTTNLTTFITLFDPTDAGATVKVVKYANDASTGNFASDTAYNNEAITNLDFFIVKVTAEDTTTILYYKVVVTVTLTIGDSYEGGIVAYILQSGDPDYDPDVQHGLIAAVADQSEGIAWITGGDTQTTWVNGLEYGGTSTDYGTGQANTNAMKAQTGYTGGAAGVCDDYENTETGTGVYDDWFLPSKDELYKLYLNKGTIGGFADNLYWSSSELKAGTAWLRNFGSGNQDYDGKNYTYRVRAVRAF